MHEIIWRYVKTLENSATINDFEQNFGIIFPMDLKKCMIKNNGGRPSINIFDTAKSKGRVFDSFFSFNKNDTDSIYTIFSILQKENKDLLPFACDPAGNILCILHDKVVFWIHETGDIENVANTFSEFIGNLYIISEQEENK